MTISLKIVLVFGLWILKILPFCSCWISGENLLNGQGTVMDRSYHSSPIDWPRLWRQVEGAGSTGNDKDDGGAYAQDDGPTKHFFIFFYNKSMARAREHSRLFRVATENFQYTSMLFFTVLEKHEETGAVVKGDNGDRYYFVFMPTNKYVLGNLTNKLTSEYEREMLQDFNQQSAQYVVRMTNKGREFSLMKNSDRFEHFFIIIWLQKQVPFPLTRALKMMERGAASNHLVGLINMIIMGICLASLLIDKNNKNFLLRRLATVPIIFFPAGNVWVQLNGEQYGNTQFLGFPVVNYSSSQTLAESMLLFAIYITFSWCAFDFAHNDGLSVTVRKQKEKEDKENKILELENDDAQRSKIGNKFGNSNRKKFARSLQPPPPSSQRPPTSLQRASGRAGKPVGGHLPLSMMMMDNDSKQTFRLVVCLLSYMALARLFQLKLGH